MIKNNKTTTCKHARLFFFFVAVIMTSQVSGQTYLAPWGNIQGVRIEGQLMPFETAIEVVNGKIIQATGKEKQRPLYSRKGVQQTVITTIEHLNITESVEDQAKGNAKVSLLIRAGESQQADVVYLLIKIPAHAYLSGTVQVDKLKPLLLKSDTVSIQKYIQQSAQSFRFSAAKQQVAVKFNSAVKALWRHDKNNFTIAVPLHHGSLTSGEEIREEFFISASGDVDHEPVSVQIDPSAQGRMFDGFGGNFRLQNPSTDPQVIDYCLQNMRVAWSRVEMPWRFWQPNKEDDPSALMKAGKLDERIKNAMLMAQRLDKMKIPVILSAWSAPNWAIVGEPRFRPTPEGVWGNPLDKSSTNEIYKSIGDYIAFLKEEYGVEVALFSFNESDLGINIRQTGEEHAELIKGLGAYLKNRGLKTKLLLGDNSDATTIKFIDPAMNDPAALTYIGAVSFHSWRGWEKELLQKWADAATKLNRPLIVGEGSIDAQAWGYPQIFLESSYALEEINLYIRLLNICQPASILQWQLTADYSPLAGGGIFGDNSALRPTQRFWNLKQLASTPKGLVAIGANSNNSNVSVAALHDKNGSSFSIHLVNNGPQRVVNLSGLPVAVKSLRIMITDQRNAMQEKPMVAVHNGNATFSLDELAYITLSTE